MTTTLPKLQKIVEKILLENPIARNDDKYLAVKVYDAYGIDVYRQLAYEILFNKITFDKITRVRRKVQRENPNLAPTDEKVKAKRDAHRKEIEDYVLGDYDDYLSRKL